MTNKKTKQNNTINNNINIDTSWYIERRRVRSRAGGWEEGVIARQGIAPTIREGDGRWRLPGAWYSFAVCVFVCVCV